jgi:predicted GNAT family acetyltransferase
MPTEVLHLPNQNRYVFQKDGKQVGFIDYTIHGDSIALTHSEVDPHLRHEGLGDEMVQAVLDTIRTETHLSVVPECPFVIDWMSRHPEYEELEAR